jgi:hypothetical protein
VKPIKSIILIVGLTAMVCAQDPRGTILGRVIDSTGLAVPNVEVRVTNIATGVVASARSNEAGKYSAPFLIPGAYEVQTSELAGFKKYVRRGIEVRVSDQVELNIVLELGQVSESVEVKDETPLLETATASLGQVIDQRRIESLPLMGGSPVELMLLTPGVISNRAMTMFKAAFSNTEVRSQGSPGFTNEFQFDGVSNTMAERGQSKEAFRPPVGAISEFKVQSSPFDATVGHSMGAVVTMSSRSGTNELHGTADFIHANTALSARSFFQNRANSPKPPGLDNRWDLAVGGPVRIPKVYDGRNKSFWYYTYHGNRWYNSRSYNVSVPTEQWRRGDFSDLLGVYQMYDPLSTVAEGSQFRRQPIPGNIIPANRIDKVGQNLANLYPLPNQPGTGVQKTSNFFITPNDNERYWSQVMRFDHAFSDGHRMFVRLHSGHWDELKNLYFGNTSGLHLQRYYRGAALDDVVTISPTMVLNLRYGLTNQDFLENRASQPFDLASLGFSQNLIRLIDASQAAIPYVSVGFQGIGTNDTGDGGSTGVTHSFSGTLHKIHGAHQIRAGADYRIYRAFEARYQRAVSPAFSFDATYTRGPYNTSASLFGQPLAAMLMGVPAGNMERHASAALQDQFVAFYVQDDWKATSRLTLNFGLRYELETPITERFNRLVGGFALDQPNPIEASATAAYAAKPQVPELPLSAFRVLGGLTFVNQAGLGRSPMRGEKNNFLPRVGFAYELTRSTVLRGGWGVFYDSIGVNGVSAIQAGFSKQTPIQWSMDNGLTRTGASIADPFPGGLYDPPGAAGGLTTNLGQNLSFYDYDLKQPYSQKWSLGVQRLLPGSLSLTTSYVANRGTRIAISRNLNVTPAQYLSTSPFRDQTTINYLGASFANPFYGLDPVYGTTQSRANLLRPYPHFGSISVEEPVGYSWYHSLETFLEKRFSRGHTLQLNYTWSKLMEATGRLNDTDPALYEAIGAFDRRHRLAGSGVWEIPVGRGRHFGAGMPAILNGVVGGWQLAGVVSITSGAPLAFGNIIFTGNPDDIALPAGQRSVDRWFNVDAGFNRNSSQQPASNIRTFPARFSNLRSDVVSRWDASLLKTFQLHERIAFQFRADVYNVWNHPSFSGPNMTPTSSAFGAITALQNVPRQWQVGGKLRW